MNLLSFQFPDRCVSLPLLGRTSTLRAKPEGRFIFFAQTLTYINIGLWSFPLWFHYKNSLTLLKWTREREKYFFNNTDWDHCEILFRSETQVSFDPVGSKTWTRKSIHVRWYDRGEVSEGGPVDGNGWGLTGTEGLVSDKYSQFLLSVNCHRAPKIFYRQRYVRTFPYYDWLPLNLWSSEIPKFFAAIDPPFPFSL